MNVARLPLLLVLLLVACREQEPPPVDYSQLGSFDTVQVRIATDTDTLLIRAELAETEEQRQLGLMERRQLGEMEGMLFVYDTIQPATGSFWMFRTRIPLDIAFIDSAGVIQAIRQMAPCASDFAQACPTYPAGVPFLQALEMNLGFFERHGVRVGHRVWRE